MPVVRAVRFPTNPIVRPEMDPRMGANVNGPSLIRVPAWVPSPLGRYYLYFGHHDGRYVRLAYADDLAGPWRTREPGVLPLADSGFRGHLASPDVHVDDERREIRMYFHGAGGPSGPGSRDRWLALGMPGVLYRSRDGLSGFEEGPTLFGPDQRHTALLLEGDTLSVFHTNAGDCPERILLSKVELRGDWSTWRASPPEVVLEPETDYEGAHLPLEPSRRGLVMGPVRQIRDPCVFREGERTYLLYAVAGENGIAIAELVP